MPKATAQARLWAPWRSTFLAKGGKGRCFFCAARRSADDHKHGVVARGRHAFVLLNRYPYNNGHLMMAPLRHIGDFGKLTSAEWQEMGKLAQSFMKKLSRTIHPHGFNLGMNLGRVAGAGVPGHLHLHLVPRWNGDTNFMPVMAQTKVISQSLEELYRLLHA